MPRFVTLSHVTLEASRVTCESVTKRSGWGGRGDRASRISRAPRPREGQLEGRLRQNRRLPTVRMEIPSAQPFYRCVAALFTCSQKSDRVVCEIQAEGGARWLTHRHQHHHLRGHGEAHARRTVALATTLMVSTSSIYTRSVAYKVALFVRV